MSGATYEWLLDETTPDSGSSPGTGITTTAAGIIGVDISCVADLDPALTLISDQRVLLAQRIARRLGTPRGGLVYDEDYGLDLRGQLNAAMTADEVLALSANIRAECLKEEAVLTVKVAVGYSANTQAMRVRIQLGSVFGTFPLTLSVSEVTVALLHGEAA